VTELAEATPAPASKAPRAHPPLGPVRRTVREVGLALIALGVIVLLFVAYQLFGTNLTEHRNQARLAKQFDTQIVQHQQTATSTPSTVPADVEPSAPPGGAIDHLVIPKIGVDKFVVEGTGEEDLRRGPGHYTGTALPGQNGNAAIAGHRTTYGAPFFRLNDLGPGDEIKITDLEDRTWIYKVSQPPEVVSPNDVAVLNPTPFAQLTLTTCNPRFSATSRLIVFARLVGQALPLPPPTKPQTHPAPLVLQGADNLGHGNSGAWTPALLYGALVIALWVGVRIWINRTRRWHRLAAYVIGIGICLVPLWFCFENAVLLLPQSI
jgi:sortase A